MDILIKNARVIDPANNINDILDLRVKDNKISETGKNLKKTNEQIIDADGLIATPGLVDMHVHLREPGREDKETIETGTQAAIAGGFCSVVAMPNTEPAVDSPDMVNKVKDIIKRTAISNVFIVGAITKNRDGKEITDIDAMKKSGLVAISDDGSSVEDEGIMLGALKQAKENSILVISHCEDKQLAPKGVMNEGITATKLGLRGIPNKSEYSIVQRDIQLAKQADARIHIAHVSCKESVEIIRKAKSQGVRVTAETAPQYFALTEEACRAYDTNTKMNPPLRTKEDIEAIKEGLKDGTIDVIASDHAPHGNHEKDVEFDNAAFGIVGLETTLGLCITHLADNVLTLDELVKKLALNPARILGIKKGTLSVGCDADITIFAPKNEWTVDINKFKSKSKNSPFGGFKLKGIVRYVICNNRLHRL